MRVRNGPPWEGMKVRRATGSDVRAPSPAENCTDSGWSPGWRGIAMRSGIVTLEWPGIFTGGDAVEVR